MRELIQKAVADGQTPSVAVGVIKNDALVWAEGFGLADRERRVPATSDTIYWLASVSKPLSATGLMQLVERGLIDLDRPANLYLGDAKLTAYVGSADDMTVRRLANHTAGLSIHNNFFDGIHPPPMDETIRRHGFASLEPGKQLQDSNLAYGILGYIVERTAKTPWREYQEKHVYDPLKMTRTSDRVRPGFEREAAVPYGSDVGGRWIRWDVYDFDHRPASSNYSTVHDLARFVRMHMNGGELDGVRVLKPESVREMQRLTGEQRPGSGYGVAWQTLRVGTHEGVTHSGGMPGVVTLVNVFPADRAATIVLSNGDNRQLIPQITRKLAQLLYPEIPDLPAPQPGTSERATPRPPAPSPALLGTWTGRLVHDDGDIPLRVIAKNGGGIDVALGTRGVVALKDPVLTDTSLAGHVEGNLHTQDSYRGMPDLRFTLTLRDGKLSGVCSAFVPRSFRTISPCLIGWRSSARSKRLDEPETHRLFRDRRDPRGRPAGCAAGAGEVVSREYAFAHDGQRRRLLARRRGPLGGDVPALRALVVHHPRIPVVRVRAVFRGERRVPELCPGLREQQLAAPLVVDLDVAVDELDDVIGADGAVDVGHLRFHVRLALTRTREIEADRRARLRGRGRRHRQDTSRHETESHAALLYLQRSRPHPRLRRPARQSASSAAGSPDRSGSSAVGSCADGSPSRLIQIDRNPSALAGAMSWNRLAAT